MNVTVNDEFKPPCLHSITTILFTVHSAADLIIKLISIFSIPLVLLLLRYDDVVGFAPIVSGKYILGYGKEETIAILSSCTLVFLCLVSYSTST